MCKVHKGISYDKLCAFRADMCMEGDFTVTDLSHLDLDDTIRQHMKGLNEHATTHFLRLHSEHA
jgi:hypothetical protein